MNEQPGLTAIHTLFAREHNRLAKQIAAEKFHDRNLDDPRVDEAIYQEARRIVGPELEVITYYEFLPALLGPDGVASYEGYDRKVDPAVANVFSAGLYRIGHTMLPAELTRLDNNGHPIAPPIALGDAFFQVSQTTSAGIEPFLEGLSANPIQEIDAKVVDGLRNFLFGPQGRPARSGRHQHPARPGSWLAGLNSAAGRFGLAPYTYVLADLLEHQSAGPAEDLPARSTTMLDLWSGPSQITLAGGNVGPTCEQSWSISSPAPATATASSTRTRSTARNSMTCSTRPSRTSSAATRR